MLNVWLTLVACLLILMNASSIIMILCTVLVTTCKFKFKFKLMGQLSATGMHASATGMQ